jgi:hypothetical protein
MMNRQPMLLCAAASCLLLLLLIDAAAILIADDVAVVAATDDCQLCHAALTDERALVTQIFRYPCCICHPTSARNVALHKNAAL